MPTPLMSHTIVLHDVPLTLNMGCYKLLWFIQYKYYFEVTRQNCNKYKHTVTKVNQPIVTSDLSSDYGCCIRE